jgi:hypothetical protein
MNHSKRGGKGMWKKRLADISIVDAVVLGAAGGVVFLFIVAGIALVVGASAP